jgi:hypothetical protein
MEHWKPIEGYKNRYLVSDKGRVRSLDITIEQGAKNGSRAKHTYKGKILKPIKHSNGYMFVECANKILSVHRLVAEAFIPKEDGRPFVNHKDGNKANNAVANLEWCDANENMRHAFDNNLIRTRTAARRIAWQKNIAKATEKNKKRILQMDGGVVIGAFDSIIEASRQTGCNATHISLCAKGKHKTCGGFVWRYA